MNEEEIVLTPMMKQFLDLKAKHPDAVMLFRCGDFYETYSTDYLGNTHTHGSLFRSFHMRELSSRQVSPLKNQFQ